MIEAALVGGRERTLSQDWMNDSLALVLGGTRVEAMAPTDPDDRLMLVTEIGDTQNRAPIGGRVRFPGFTLLGS